MRNLTEDDARIEPSQIYVGPAAVEELLFRVTVREAEERSKLRTVIGGLPVGGAAERIETTLP